MKTENEIKEKIIKYEEKLEEIINDSRIWDSRESRTKNLEDRIWYEYRISELEWILK